MVNNQLKKQREERIAWIIKFLEKTKSNPDKKENLVMKICVRFEVSQRKAAEYLRIATFQSK